METRPEHCGECQACCEIIEVQLWKPANQICPHQFEGGCKVYSRRPAECKEYTCLWLVIPELPERFRPDKLGMVVSPALVTEPMSIRVNVSPKSPFAWAAGDGQDLIRLMLMRGLNVIVVLGEHYLRLPSIVPPQPNQSVYDIARKAIQDATAPRPTGSEPTQPTQPASANSAPADTPTPTTDTSATATNTVDAADDPRTRGREGDPRSHA